LKLNKKLPPTSVALHAGNQADNEFSYFKRIVLTWDKEVVPITSTQRTASR